MILAETQRRRVKPKPFLCDFASLREKTYCVLLVSFFFIISQSDTAGAEATVAPILKDLQRPCGVAVRAGGTADRYEVFIAESGAGRVVRWSNLAPKQSYEVVTGFPTMSAADPFHQAGPLALWFLDPGLLAVGTTRDVNGDLVRTYELPDGEKALPAETTIELGSGSDHAVGTTCFAITRSRANEFVPDMLVLAVRDPEGHARLMKARVQAGIIGEPQPFGPQESTKPPRAVAISNSGRIIVGDAAGRLTFYNPIDGKVELTMPTNLKELIGLAYSPTTGSLYVADFAGGIYRVDDASKSGRPACRTVKIADVNKPTALAFAPDGSLYVVTFGAGNDNGTLEVLSGDL